MLGSVALSMCNVAAGRLRRDAVSLREARSVDVAAGQLIVREAGGAVAFPDAGDLAAPLDLDMRSRVVAAASPAVLREMLALAAKVGPSPRRVSSRWWPRLRRATAARPGITRRKHGKGFEYVDEDGDRIEDKEVLERICELVIPPAWEDVWICPWPMGHIQATGVDQPAASSTSTTRSGASGATRRSSTRWSSSPTRCPPCASGVAAHLDDDGMTRERVLACAVRLLDRGFFRVGGEDYAVDNESYGLATIHKEHVSIEERRARVRLPREERQAQDPVDRRPRGRTTSSRG